MITFSDNSRVIVKKGQDAAAPQVEIGSNGNWFVNGVDTGKPSQGADGQNGQSLTIQKTELDADGNTLVTFSDGSTITIHKGTDAQAPQIYIGSNGNWFVNDVDTGKQAQGPQGQAGAAGQNGADGKDAQPLSIVTSKLDEAGNTVISFSDGSQVSVSKGQDGNNPVITIDSNGYWVVNGQLTTTKAKGEDGRDGQAPTVEIGSNGNWIINGKDTGVPAKGVDGKDGQVVTGQALGDNPVTTFVKGLLPATGSEQNIALLLLFGSAFMLFGGYLLGRRKSD